MRTYKRAPMLIGLLAVLLLAAACGSTAAAPSPTPTPAPPTPKPTPSTSVAAVNTGSVMVKGQATIVLTDAQGKTLYYFKKDTATQAACTGGCTGTWPPLLLTSGTPTSAGSLPGKLTVVTDANGNQAQYNGHFLYTFSGDSAPGQANGEGIANSWFVATPSLT